MNDGDNFHHPAAIDLNLDGDCLAILFALADERSASEQRTVTVHEVARDLLVAALYQTNHNRRSPQMGGEAHPENTEAETVLPDEETVVDAPAEPVLAEEADATTEEN